MSYLTDIETRLMDAYERDLDRHIKKWMVTWEYVEGLKKRRLRPTKEMPEDFDRFTGPADLIKWFNWIKAAKRPDYFDDETVAPLIQMSRNRDLPLLKRHSLAFDPVEYDEYIGRYNAQDYLFQNFYPTPRRYGIKRILDFGAGYGRQANIWSQKVDDLVYVGMDAVPLSYCLQHFYYSNLEVPFFEYVADPSGFRFDSGPGIYHIPTWRFDLLPDSFFEMVTCVQVLQEIPGTLLRHMAKVFSRVLKPGGCLYIRDSENWQFSHSIDVYKLLEENGFVLEFRPHVVNKSDIHGIPRIWRRVDPAVRDSQRADAKTHVVGRIKDLDARMGGIGKRIKSTLKKS
jgi:SAM-dependent methyltransferase